MSRYGRLFHSSPTNDVILLMKFKAGTLPVQRESTTREFPSLVEPEDPPALTTFRKFAMGSTS